MAMRISSPSAVVVAVVVLLPLGVVGTATAPVVLRVVLLVVGVGIGRSLLLSRVGVFLHVVLLLASFFLLLLLSIVRSTSRRRHRELFLVLGTHTCEGLGTSRSG